jgi:hypothetical protein
MFFEFILCTDFLFSSSPLLEDFLSFILSSVLSYFFLAFVLVFFLTQTNFALGQFETLPPTLMEEHVWIEGVCEHGAEGNIWTSDRGLTGE